MVIRTRANRKCDYRHGAAAGVCIRARASGPPKMTMRIIALVLSLATLMWAEAATAQKTYSLSVNHHTAVPVSEAEVKGILDRASQVLQRNSHPDCNVTFTLKGEIRNFPPPNVPFPPPGEPVVTKDNIKAVHRLDSNVADIDFRVKIVKEIHFCRPDIPHPVGLFDGCSFFREDSRSIIVVHPKFHKNPDNPGGEPLSSYPDHLLWAHEFGHLTGLPHRRDQSALMTPCSLAELPDDRVGITRAECKKFRSGPGAPPPRPMACAPRTHRP
jgi:Matrixin